MSILLDPSVKKISLANPEHAPYGRAAVAALRHFRLYERVSDRFVFGENVSQAAQFVESGNAQAGFVALSHAMAPRMREKGRYWIIPSDAYPALQQAAVILSHSSKKAEAVVALPIVLPPTVLGFYLLIALGPRSPLGRWWQALTGHTLAFTFEGLVIGSIIYSLPFAVQPFSAAFGTVDRRLLAASATLG